MMTRLMRAACVLQFLVLVLSFQSAQAEAPGLERAVGAAENLEHPLAQVRAVELPGDPFRL